MREGIRMVLRAVALDLSICQLSDPSMSEASELASGWR